VAGIRTVMVTTPALLSDLIRKLALGRVELDVVAELDGRQALARRLQQLRPDLVVIGLRCSESATGIIPLLGFLPKTKFIMFSQDGRSIIGYEPCLGQTRLSDLSPEGLMRFIQRDEEETSA
jgi:hypothetical protein